MRLSVVLATAQPLREGVSRVCRTPVALYLWQREWILLRRETHFVLGAWSSAENEHRQHKYILTVYKYIDSIDTSYMIYKKNDCTTIHRSTEESIRTFEGTHTSINFDIRFTALLGSTTLQVQFLYLYISMGYRDSR